MTAQNAPAAVMTVAELEETLRREFPEMWADNAPRVIESVGYLTARVRSVYSPAQLRPGGTISGPTMMALADLALYAAIMASIGPVTLAVTTNLSFNFLRKPAPKDLIADCRLLKLGKRLAVGEVSLYSDGEDGLVCHATGTYSIPPR
ncbi:PaaI family thioesterase [Camelimonas abortus]|uniref:PaaI family thioesterase n=1 Tax=Camelimonas abortus TaxID=1017184 RepID=A0ABV7LFW3_9HYPH